MATPPSFVPSSHAATPMPQQHVPYPRGSSSHSIVPPAEAALPPGSMPAHTPPAGHFLSEEDQALYRYPPPLAREAVATRPEPPVQKIDTGVLASALDDLSAESEFTVVSRADEISRLEEDEHRALTPSPSPTPAREPAKRRPFGGELDVRTVMAPRARQAQLHEEAFGAVDSFADTSDESAHSSPTRVVDPTLLPRD